ncbi:hypothetical protein Daud_1521 [Candidatus Desulforudis audaxviator MP104C]|uniref:Uncharacterized protein n=1 Tax=Desulforudis audaxviator (strain MP104C) TaxID=477974 RepID=B1I4V6_DESAP|nr:hypothetical protein Daud_1521 [Candidatus Desulforudis audaxviator MP104C]
MNKDLPCCARWQLPLGPRQALVSVPVRQHQATGGSEGGEEKNIRHGRAALVAEKEKRQNIHRIFLPRYFGVSLLYRNAVASRFAARPRQFRRGDFGVALVYVTPPIPNTR